MDGDRRDALSHYDSSWADGAIAAVIQPGFLYVNKSVNPLAVYFRVFFLGLGSENDAPSTPKSKTFPPAVVM